METAEKTLVKSSFLKIQARKEGFNVLHLVSGRQFDVCKATIGVVEHFKRPREIKLDELNPSMHQSIQRLISCGILVDTAQANQETSTTHIPNKTLFKVPAFDPSSSGSKFTLIGIPFGGGNAESSETRKFPHTLRAFAEAYSLNLNQPQRINYNFLGNAGQQIHLDEWIKTQKLADAGDIFIHHFESRSEIYEKITNIFGSIFEKGHRTFGIGGDHSITYPIIKAAAQHHKAFSVLHFDAHTDLYSSSYEPILNGNGLHHHGNFVEKCLMLPQLNTYYQFGIRGVNNIFHQDAHPKLKIMWADEVKRKLRLNLIDALPHDQSYYITFDIDVLDPSVAPGTATPVPNGLFFEEILQLFNDLKIAERNIIGVDFVEVNPKYDAHNVTVSLASQLIINFLNLIKP